MASSRIRIVSFVEGPTVAGAVKNLLDFAELAREAPSGMPAVDSFLMTYHRGDAADRPETAFLKAAKRAAIPVDIVYERGRFDRRLVPQIAATLDRLHPDIVQTHNTKSHFLMRYSGLARKHRWIAFHHGYTSTDLKMRLYHELDRWSLRAPEHVVTVCGPFKRLLTSRGVPRSRISVQHNAIHPFAPASETEVAEARARLRIPEGTPVLLVVGRLSHEKGHLDLIEALAILKRRSVAFHALFAGEGPERTQIENALTRLQLKDLVTVAGQQNDIRPLYGMASIFVMPSHSEGSPNALLEAMAAGVPIVASDVGGIPEIVTNGETALLTPARNPAMLAQALDRLLTAGPEAFRLAENAKAATSNFNYEAYHRGLMAIYQRVLNAPSVGHCSPV